MKRQRLSTIIHNNFEIFSWLCTLISRPAIQGWSRFGLRWHWGFCSFEFSAMGYPGIPGLGPDTPRLTAIMYSVKYFCLEHGRKTLSRSFCRGKLNWLKIARNNTLWALSCHRRFRVARLLGMLNAVDVLEVDSNRKTWMHNHNRDGYRQSINFSIEWAKLWLMCVILCHCHH